MRCSIWPSRFPDLAAINSPRPPASNGVVLIASLFEKRAPGIYHNTAAIFDSDGSLRGLYRKMHIPDDPLYYEKFYFTPGDLGFRALDTSAAARHAGLLGPVVSRGRAPDRAARRDRAFLSHGDRLASGGEGRVRRGQHDAWRTIQRAHAIANGVYVAVVNRVGFETGNIRGKSTPGQDWNSGALVPLRSLRPRLAEASHDREEILMGDVDLKLWKRSAATGPFCATAASTPTPPSPTGCWTDDKIESLNVTAWLQQ